MRPQMVVVLLIPLYKYIANWDPLENSTFGLDLYLIASNVVTDQSSVLPFCPNRTEQVNQSSVSEPKPNRTEEHSHNSE